jgi:hypothetical protein
MVVCRILFLCTYDTTLDFEALVSTNALGDNINHVSISNSESDVFGRWFADCPSKLHDTQSNFLGDAESPCPK